MHLNCRGRKIKIKTLKLSSFGKVFGLMFRTSDCDNILFEFDTDEKMAFHSFFCFFPFLILWLDEKNNVLDWKIVHPFELRISTSKSFRKVVEIPLNKRNMKVVHFFVGKERFK